MLVYTHHILIQIRNIMLAMLTGCYYPVDLHAYCSEYLKHKTAIAMRVS